MPFDSYGWSQPLLHELQPLRASSRFGFACLPHLSPSPVIKPEGKSSEASHHDKLLQATYRLRLCHMATVLFPDRFVSHHACGAEMSCLTANGPCSYPAAACADRFLGCGACESSARIAARMAHFAPVVCDQSGHFLVASITLSKSFHRILALSLEVWLLMGWEY